MFLKEKYNALEFFTKMKARLFAGGKKQDKTLYKSLSSVFMILAIVAIQKQNAATVDITSAYLECLLDENDEVQ